MSENRGFDGLVGELITAVDAKCINEVVITTESGRELAIVSEQGPLNIPVLCLEDRTAPVSGRLTRQQAVVFARRFAKGASEADRERFGYLNFVDNSWVPHDWVVEAIMEASDPDRSL